MAKKRIQYRFDNTGNRSAMVDPDGGRFTYAYDSLNRISHLENPQNERTSYQYDAAGRRTAKKMANGTRASFSYDVASNLTVLANLKSDQSVISSFDYRYDKSSNRTAVLEADGSRVTWSYDATYQLTGEHRTGSNAYRNTFTYDPAGNRTLKNEDMARTTYAYDAANQLTTSQDLTGTTTYTFDDNGNQQIVQPPAGNRTTTTWDHENRTTLVELSSGVRNTMAFEPDGLRVKLEDSTGTKKFIWDDQNYLAETDASDVTLVVYTNEPAYYWNLISQRRGSTTNLYHFDAIGSTRDLTLANESVSDTYIFDAWGVLVDSTGVTNNAFQFAGEHLSYFNVDCSTIYARHHRFTPVGARWLSTWVTVGPTPTLLDHSDSVGENALDSSGVPILQSQRTIEFLLLSYAVPPHLSNVSHRTPAFFSYLDICPPSGDRGIGPKDRKHCTWLIWLLGKCCTLRQVANAKACCLDDGKCLKNCSQLNSKGGYGYNCEKCENDFSCEFADTQETCVAMTCRVGGETAHCRWRKVRILDACICECPLGNSEDFD